MRFDAWAHRDFGAAILMSRAPQPVAGSKHEGSTLLSFISGIRNKQSPSPPPAVGSAGKRCYAIGDVHGRLDLLRQLFAQIEAHGQTRPETETFIVLLGDLIDRGPDSRGVLDYLLERSLGSDRLIILAGNHETMLLAAMTGERHALNRWLANGGDACVRSYGLDPRQLQAHDAPGVVHSLESAIPLRHREFVRSFSDSVRFGDYLLVHAGIRPGNSIAQQRPDDLRWIRSEFLDSDLDHGARIVHGHSNLTDVEFRHNRIGIDTSAHRTGVLTALWIDGAEYGLLQTCGAGEDADGNSTEGLAERPPIPAER